MSFAQLRAAACLAAARRFLVAFALVAVPTLSSAQSADMYKDRIRTWSSIAPLADAAFGERYDLYKGELSFHQEDLRLPGTGPDIVVGRTFAVDGATALVGPRGFQDWEITIPRLVTKSPATTVWQAAGAEGYGSNRCSNFGGQPPGVSIFASHKWWNGIQLVDQGGGMRDAMPRVQENPLAPGGTPATYPGVTKDYWQFSCLPQTANGQPGEGILGLAPDGSKYWFDWLVLSDASNSQAEQGLDGHWYTATFYKAMLLVTRIEDRFGNALVYHYDGKRLLSISASDGRQVTFAWATDGSHITGMTTADRQWTYEYTGGLSRLVYPDGSDLRFNLGDLFGYLYDSQSSADCNPQPTEESLLDGGPGPALHVGSMTGPSGLTGVFTVRQVLRGRSRVPAGCISLMGQPDHATISALFVTESLVSRQYTGPGGVNSLWQYQYSAPVASWASCTSCTVTTAATTVTAPDGSVSRTTYSTEWGAYEGKVLMEEEGVTTSGALRTTTYQYAPTDGMAYPGKIGRMPLVYDAIDNDTPAQTYSPLWRKVVTQQGRTFTWEVAATCGGTGTSLCFDAYARPTRVVKASTP